MGLFPGEPTARLYVRLAEVLRSRHYSPWTEQAYIHRIRRFIRFHCPLQDGCHIGTAQELLGHNDIKTTMAQTHVLNGGRQGVPNLCSAHGTTACQNYASEEK